jgi:hypothetical protein
MTPEQDIIHALRRKYVKRFLLLAEKPGWFQRDAYGRITTPWRLSPLLKILIFGGAALGWIVLGFWAGRLLGLWSQP